MKTIFFAITVALTLALSLAMDIAQAALPIRAADPYILVHEGTYYLYGTDDLDASGGIKVYRSKDLQRWEGPVGVHPGGYALKRGDAFGSDHFWNGDIRYHRGRFVLHYTANEQVAVAYAPSPLGPFTNPLKKPFRDDIKEIDTDLFVDEDGTAYFYFVRFDKGNVTYAAKMNADLSGIDEQSVKEVIRASQPWEHTDTKSNWPVTEAASVIKHRNLYYLFYTANDFRNPDYAVGMATAPHPLGPWTKYAGNPILRSSEGFRGTGSTHVFRDLQGRWQIVFHAHAPTSRDGASGRQAEDWSPRRAMIVEARWHTDPAGGPEVLRPVGKPRALKLNSKAR
jgi:xylan 1,4-beta-xylosidase